MTAAGKDAAAVELRRIDTLLHRRQIAEARAACDAFLSQHPLRPEGWLVAARVRQAGGDFHGMLAAAQRALALDPGGELARFMEIEARIHAGDVAGARAGLSAIEQKAGPDSGTWRRLAEFHTHLGQHEAAAGCATRVATLRPYDPDAAYARASALIATGKFEQAEAILNELIRRNPADGDAWYNRATLRRQTPERNHVAELRERIAGATAGNAPVALYFALAKELEDLGEYEASFAALGDGNAARRRLLSYRVEDDVATMDAIIAAFDAGWLARPGAGFEAEGPVFVVGLPRSGTTLVERILARHESVASVGEVTDLALAVIRLAGPAEDKAALVRRASAADPAALGESYWRAIQGYGRTRPFTVDKTPLNFLYLGLIARALPKARIVHLRRHPMASCHAMYKTLFRMGYPFSYDLADLGAYYLAYRRLMAHWRGLLPGRIHDVDYERLVDDQEGETRRLLEFLGLPWRDNCLRFHEEESPTLTASAAQVRRPIYRESRDLWRRYAQGLAPLAKRLADAGVDVA